jgi:hypothetical protein
MKMLHVAVLVVLFYVYSGNCGFAAPGQRDIEVDQDRLSVAVDQVPLEEIMQELSDKTGLVFVMQTASGRKLTVQFKDLPIVEGLRRLLNPDSFVIEYGPGAQKGREVVKKVIVYGDSQKGAGRNVFRPQVAPEQAAGGLPGLIKEAGSEPEAEQEPENSIAYYNEQLTSQDPDVRENAVIDFADDHGDKALPFLEKSMLGDDNSDVRAAAAGTIGGLQMKEGIASLTRALDDADDGVRMAVLEALGEIGGKDVLPALQKALNDSNEDIRDDAQALIEEIKE